MRVDEKDWRELVREAADRLTAAGVDSARVDAEWLACEVAGVDRARLAFAPPPGPDAVRRFRDMVAARAARRPLQHVIGTAPFWRRDLAVGQGVFIPRPETELLVEWALPRLAGTRRPVVVDLCAGSGALASAVMTERSDARVFAVEAEPAALHWLRRNLAVGAEVVEGDATSPETLRELDGRVDLVLTNPPYVPEGTPVSPEVAADPATAVFGGPDGLDVIRPLVHRVAALLRPGGNVAIEHDDTHGEAVPALLVAAGLDDVVAHRDLSGRPRFATARRAGDPGGPAGPTA
ncbi:peptide chain release factor N(5)-glutamine methyltransferase [Stackebrandtia albiflava]|nr:peptide chain release factor N(5)-glutamine methyltransferase [Stackebrandtia albiflava]